ncbi:hypothetical protein VaNZ11_000880 [Volvox africanus]|uniref:Pherophorin domain-containing protein n=1 Tax=Volvox africanus TaxID=51714 RepID=A0ABQ5RNC0_9CHLO|nr:hypothetical protein VaNZ11_000880 [Volvox africanus]
MCQKLPTGATMGTNPAGLCALVTLLLAVASTVHGHGGGLHTWSFLPVPTPGKEVIRYVAASCSSWAPVDPALGVLGPLPVFPATAAKLRATGSISVVYYLNGNCTDQATTCLDVNVNLTLNDKPYAGRQVNGYGFIGNCSNPNDLYRHNYTLGDNRFNLVWFRKENSVTTENGTLWGAAPNVMISRQPPASDALRSIVLFPSPADSDPICCTLNYGPPPPADFFTQGSFCRVPAPPPPSPRPPVPRVPRSPPRLSRPSPSPPRKSPSPTKAP